jgi:hypothetical protein
METGLTTTRRIHIPGKLSRVSIDGPPEHIFVSALDHEARNVIDGGQHLPVDKIHASECLVTSDRHVLAQSREEPAARAASATSAAARRRRRQRRSSAMRPPNQQQTWNRRGSRP